MHTRLTKTMNTKSWGTYKSTHFDKEHGITVILDYWCLQRICLADLGISGSKSSKS